MDRSAVRPARIDRHRENERQPAVIRFDSTYSLRGKRRVKLRTHCAPDLRRFFAAALMCADASEITSFTRSHYCRQLLSRFLLTANV